jgi:hypothetical protein
VIDFVARFGQAEKRPEGAPFEAAQHTLAGRSRATLVVPASSRVIWTTLLPRRATLRVQAGLPPSASGSVRFRIGVSDDRVYDKLAEQIVAADAGWVALEADLRWYAGRQWSLFHRPEGRQWRVVFSTDHVAGAVSHVFWGEPVVEADMESARRFRSEYGARAVR